MWYNLRMDVLWFSLGGLCLLLGFIGCVVPVLPGPPLGFVALLTLISTSTPLPMGTLYLAGGLMATAMVLDYVLPALGAKKFQCSGWGTFGCFFGTLVGVFFFPFGLILGPFLGAACGELLAGKNFTAACRGGCGAMLGFLATVFLKFAVVGLDAYWFGTAVSAWLRTSA